MVFYNGFYFALRSWQEHRQLRRDTPQIELVERPSEHVYLKYTEDISKNRPGDLKGCKASSKVVIHHANTEIPERCFVRLYKLYMEKYPSDAAGMPFTYDHLLLSHLSVGIPGSPWDTPPSVRQCLVCVSCVVFRGSRLIILFEQLPPHASTSRE